MTSSQTTATNTATNAATLQPVAEERNLLTVADSTASTSSCCGGSACGSAG